MVLLAEGAAWPRAVVRTGPEGAPERGLCLGVGGGEEAGQEGKGLPAKAEGAPYTNAVGPREPWRVSHRGKATPVQNREMPPLNGAASARGQL